jgi:DNA invertase Pin-like site-specific DNA recombinase
MNSTLAKRVALYARVSTCNGQQDPELQLRELREYARLRGLTIVGEYVDRISGSKDSRPALNQLMADASQRKFDAVLVWKLDRFGRSLRHLVNALAELEAFGLSFISLRDNLDLSTPSGRLMFQIIGAMAEFERSLTQERGKAGLRNARAKGKRLGRPPVFVSQSRLDTLRASGASWRAISKELGVGNGSPNLPAAFQKPLAGVVAQALWSKIRKFDVDQPHLGPRQSSRDGALCAGIHTTDDEGI